MKNTSRIYAFFKSLRFRMIVLILVISIVPGIILEWGILHSYETRALSIRESEVLSQAQMLANQISTSAFLTDTAVATDTLVTQMDMITTIYGGRMIIVDDTYRIVYDTYNLDYYRYIISNEVISSMSGNTVMNPVSEGDYHYLEMTLPIINPNESTGTVLGVLLVSVSTDNIALTHSYLGRVALIIMVGVVTLVMFLGILFTIFLLRPLRTLSEQIANVKTGYGEETLCVNDYTETAHISEQFNEMLARLKVMDQSRQEFVSNVSHELKTPLTSMKVLADSINSMPDAPLELYQEFMGDITNEIERETKIINDLLSLVKMDKSAADLNISSLNINELIEQILKRLQPIADKQHVELVLESFRPIIADVDEVKITLAITNLIENGIKYNRTDGEGWVHVSLNADHQYFYLKVEDSGIGIPEDSLEQIYERFYRVDKSHSREIGGTGLGLAITRSSILMHKGAIKVYSVEGEGTTFDVRIPLKFIS